MLSAVQVTVLGPSAVFRDPNVSSAILYLFEHVSALKQSFKFFLCPHMHVQCKYMDAKFMN